MSNDATDPLGYFANPRAMSFHVNFRDHQGWAGVFTANASWCDDGDFMSIGFGLKEVPMSIEEMRAVYAAIGSAISAREENDKAMDKADA